jgi:hypothetical protein
LQTARKSGQKFPKFPAGYWTACGRNFGYQTETLKKLAGACPVR